MELFSLYIVIKINFFVHALIRKITEGTYYDLDVRCSVTMEDGSELYIFYGGKMIFDEKSDKLNEEIKTLTPKKWLAFWVSAPLIRT